MEIRHDDAYWNDKYEDLLKIAGAFRDERNQLRSQLSEALSKIREYREAEERVERERKAPAAFKALALVEMLKSFADRARRESEFFKRTGAGTKGVGDRADEELRPLKDRLIEAGCVGPIAAKIATAYDRQPPWGTKAERVLIQIVMKGQFSRDDFLMLLEDAPWLFQSIRAARDAFQGMGDSSQPIELLVAQMWEPDEIKGKSPTCMIVDELAQPVPHHGPGLSEAEDAMRDDGVPKKDDRVTVVDPESGLRAKIPRSCFNSDGVLDVLKPINPLLRLILEKAPFGGIYYKLQDRKTLRLIQNGIAADAAAVLSLIPEADREPIYETRRYGMGVGE